MHEPPDGVYEALCAVDPDVLDAAELDELIRRIAALESWCAALKVRATRRQRALAAEGRACDPRHALSNSGGQSSRDAKAASERESVCTAMPGFEDALAEGQVSAGHVDAIAHATRGLSEEDRAEFTAEAEALLDDAASQTVDAFEKNCRDLAKSIRARNNARADIDELERQRQQSKVSRWVDRETGMHKTLIETDPLTDRRIWSAVQRARKALRRRQKQSGGQLASFDRLTVDSVVEAMSAVSDDHPRRHGVDGVIVHVGLDRLVGGGPSDGPCETDSGVELPAETVRRLACEAQIIPVVLDGRGVVLDEGRAKRLATPDQRVAIEAMHTTCSFPNCSVTIDECRVHHIDFWEHGGQTDLDRMAPVCETHHHLVHEGGWTFKMTTDRVGTWIRPDGTVHWSGPLIDRAQAA